MSDEIEFGPPPAALPDRRVVYRKINERWYPIDLCDVERNDLIAVLDDPDLNPDDVQLWIVNGIPYQLPSGLWSVRVLPASDQYKCLEKPS